MVDDKKDLGKDDLEKDDFDALSDALGGSGDFAPSLEDLLKNHGIDLDSPQDLDAMQDFSFNEQPNEKTEETQPMPMMDDFQSDAHLFSDDLFAEPPPVQVDVAPKKNKMQEPPKVQEDVALFEASDFDDNTAFFDEAQAQEAPLNDDDALFDYDPHTEATFADLGSAEPDFMGSDDALGGGAVPPPVSEKSTHMKGMFMRLGMLFVLASVIYGGIRLVTGGKTQTEASNGLTTTPPPSQIAHLPAQQAPSNATETKPAVSAQPNTVAPVTAPVPAAVVSAPASHGTENPMPMPVPGTVTSGLPTTTPVVTAQAESGVTVPTPQTSLPVTVPMSASPTGMPAMSSSSAPMDIQQKLDNLETALRSIDQRLSLVGPAGMGDEKMQRLERLVNDSSAPEMQQVLAEAVSKMKELDRKLERISELQQQVRKLDSEVKMLKEDVVTQTNMVGEQQRLFNDNVQVSQLKEPGPVQMIVQAAIPGRAWLRSERGELLTVIPGDEVPGYGRVVSIDAASGTVVTSSRAVFREQ